MYDFFARQPRWVKFVIAVLIDCISIIAALFTALALRLNTNWPMDRFLQSMPLLALLLVCGFALSYLMNISSIRLRSFENTAIVRTIIWSIALMLIGTFANAFFSLGAPRTVPVIMAFVVFVYSIALRLNAVLLLNYLQGASGRIPVAVYGAGAGGQQLISALKLSSEYRPVMFVDDNKHIRGLLIGGYKVYSPDVLERYIKTGRVKSVLLAIPSISILRKRQIIQDVNKLGCEVMELPSYVDLIKGGGLLKSLRQISPEDLLGRDGVDLEIPELTQSYAGKNVLVTGAGGSIGSELCRKLFAIKPKKIVLFEQSEFALYQIDQELSEIDKDHNIEIIPALGSVTDMNRVRSVLEREKIEIVFHAAAYKHVPIVECNELEGAKTNIVGTYTLAKLSIETGVKRFIMISTDKAVRPTNVMGASKRLAELVIQDLHSNFGRGKSKKKANLGGCVFGIVRFGNVLGSSGSVIPLFKRQIANGGPVTLTHGDVTRYFMTINEAAFLVLLAGSYAETSEVFLLDMGQPIRILDLARRMIELSGMSVKDGENPDGDIEIKVTGLRPGEKLFEELLIGAGTLPTPHPKILRALENQPEHVDSDVVVKKFSDAILANDPEMVRGLLKQWVEDYQQVQ